MDQYQTLAQIIKKTPKLNRLVPKVLHRGSSGAKRGMWRARRSLVAILVKRFPKRFQDMGVREASRKVVQELIEA